MTLESNRFHAIVKVCITQFTDLTYGVITKDGAKTFEIPTIL